MGRHGSFAALGEDETDDDEEEEEGDKSGRFREVVSGDCLMSL